jgi:trimethylamine:corrinoid methyltransferase-like protein
MRQNFKNAKVQVEVHIMIQTNSIEKRGPFFNMLSHDQIMELIRATFEIMGKVGFRVLHAEARAMLKQAGAIVKKKSGQSAGVYRNPMPQQRPQGMAALQP